MQRALDGGDFFHPPEKRASMTRNLRNLPGTELGKNGLGQRFTFAAKARDLIIDVDLGIVTNKAQFLDFCFEFRDRLFKIKEF